METVKAIQDLVAEHRDDIIEFMREIVAIPSMDGQLKEVGERIVAEMKPASTRWATSWDG